MKTRVFYLAFIILAIVLVGCSTSTTGPNGPGPDTTTDASAPDCNGDDCGGEGDVVFEVDCGENCGTDTGPDVVECENNCELGQILCTTETRYKECEKDGEGCLDFTSATVFCPQKTECICGEADAWCDLGESEACVCVPECDGKDCGPDGCGDFCGVCDEGFDCDQDNGLCVEDVVETCDECVAACADGTGINCCEEDQQKCNGVKIIDCVDEYSEDDACACWKWPATEGEDCDDPLQLCLDLPEDLGACVCEFLTCDNGCCATAAYTTCDSFGDCCVPNCDGLECGDDGCGGSCGDCPEGNYCELDTGTCLTVCDPTCSEPGVTECDTDFSVKTCIDFPIAGEPCYIWDSEVFDCPAQNVCEDGECVCQPNCLGKNCGDDGCGGECGDCGEYPNECTEDGVCECVCPDLYQPVCDEQACETYFNYCEASCNGVSDVSQGACDCGGCDSSCVEDDWNFGPVCGVDGVTYQTFCDLKCSDDSYDNGCDTPDTCLDELAKVGECDPILEYCAGTGCPVDFNPMCGSDNVTYWNYCCFEMIAPDDVEYFCQGECVDPTICPDAAIVCSPVCGLDDQGAQISYINAQVQDCLGATPLYPSACCDSTSLAEDWVCVDNEGTLEGYLNNEVMSCVDPAFSVLYPVPTDAFGDWLLDVCTECQCDLSETDESTWLCGSDFNTYDDQCALNCFAADNDALSSVPICDTGCGFMLDECPCPPDVGGAIVEPVTDTDTGARGVCGDDGYTYANLCDATYNGVPVVLDQWCDECEDLCKGEGYAPLCCKLGGPGNPVVTGVTYPNACVVDNCSDAYVTGDCFSGECCLDASDCDDGNDDTIDTCNEVTFVCDSI